MESQENSQSNIIDLSKSQKKLALSTNIYKQWIILLEK